MPTALGQREVKQYCSSVDRRYRVGLGVGEGRTVGLGEGATVGDGAGVADGEAVRSRVALSEI